MSWQGMRGKGTAWSKDRSPPFERVLTAEGRGGGGSLCPLARLLGRWWRDGDVGLGCLGSPVRSARRCVPAPGPAR
eukprot:scaffold2297_cov102-Isochrysis_galbana.AAC.12